MRVLLLLLLFSGKYQVNTYYGKNPVNTLPGIYQVFTWVFTQVFTRSVFTWSFYVLPLANLRNFTKF